jgi:gas vesicle protein
MKKQNWRDILSTHTTSKLRIFVLLGALFLLPCINIFTRVQAQNSGTNSNTAAPDPTVSSTATPNPTVSVSPKPSESKPTGTPELPSLKDVRVTGVKNAIDNSNSAGIGESIVLAVDNLKNLKNFADCLSLEDKPVLPCTKQKVALFLNGREIKDTYPEWVKPDSKEVGFHLQRSPDSDEAWADLLGAPPFPTSKDFYEKPNVSVNVGLKDSYALGGSSDQISLRRTSRGWFILGILFLISLLITIFVLAMYSDVLRNTGLGPQAQVTGWRFKKKARKPYSLARFQMAFWFVFVVGAFLFIWLITGASDTVTTTALSLIGIGAGTALGAAIIDVGKPDTGDKDNLKNLQKREKELEDEIAALDAQIKNTAAGTDTTLLEAQKKEKDALLKTARDSIAEIMSRVKTSKDFLTDILRDDNGEVSFHRFQMFIWTLVLGILFIHSVWYRLSMPEFGGTLIALLGISAGTYLGFKIPENNTAPKQ